MTDKDQLILRSGSEGGALLVDGLGDGVMISISNPSSETFDLNTLRVTSFNLLQGSRMRSVKTDFVSCPSCGRTLFDLKEVARIFCSITLGMLYVSLSFLGDGANKAEDGSPPRCGDCHHGVHCQWTRRDG